MNITSADIASIRRPTTPEPPSKPLTIGKAWRSFEKLVRLGLMQSIELIEIPRQGGKFVGNKFVPQRVAVDFVGVIKANGKAFLADAKCCSDPKSFCFSEMLMAHQRDELVRCGEAYAVSGLIVEARFNGMIYWIDWHQLQTRAKSIEWRHLPIIGSSANGLPRIAWEKFSGGEA